MRFVVRRGKAGIKLGHGALTVDFRAGCSSCSMTYSFVDCSTDRKSCELLTSASTNLVGYTYLDSWLTEIYSKVN